VLKRGDIVAVISNPYPDLNSTEKYISEPAEIAAIINPSTVVLCFCDGKLLTVNISCIEEL
jgi:hypothetical protein